MDESGPPRYPGHNGWSADKPWIERRFDRIESELRDHRKILTSISRLAWTESGRAGIVKAIFISGVAALIAVVLSWSLPPRRDDADAVRALIKAFEERQSHAPLQAGDKR